MIDKLSEIADMVSEIL